MVMTDHSQHVEPMLSGAVYGPSEARQPTCVDVEHLYRTSSMTKSKVPLEWSEGRCIVMTNMYQHIEPTLSGVVYGPPEARQPTCVGIGDCCI